MKIIIPMAGLGSRFKKVAHQNPEYQKPKPFILVHGKPMVRWASGSLPFLRHPEDTEYERALAHPKDLIFVILKEHDDQFNIEQGLRDIYSDAITVIKLPQVTRGAAETALAAKEYINSDEELIISDSDHFFNGAELERTIKDTKTKNIDGIIPVFRARNEGVAKWSYTLTHPGTLEAARVAEKDPDLMNAGAFANIGAYYFSKGRSFVMHAEKMIRENKTSGTTGKGEFYIAPIYQEMLQAGMRIVIAEIPEVWGLGTPEDLEYFYAHYRYEK